MLTACVRLANLTQASQVIDYICICIIYLFFHRALKAQGFNRNDLPYKGWAQPFCGWYGLCALTFVVICYGYTVFLPGCKFLWSPAIESLLANARCRVGCRNIFLLLHYGLLRSPCLSCMENPQKDENCQGYRG